MTEAKGSFQKFSVSENLPKRQADQSFRFALSTDPASEKKLKCLLGFPQKEGINHFYKPLTIQKFSILEKNYVSKKKRHFKGKD